MMQTTVIVAGTSKFYNHLTLTVGLSKCSITAQYRNVVLCIVFIEPFICFDPPVQPISQASLG